MRTCALPIDQRQRRQRQVGILVPGVGRAQRPLASAPSSSASPNDSQRTPAPRCLLAPSGPRPSSTAKRPGQRQQRQRQRHQVRVQVGIQEGEEGEFGDLIAALGWMARLGFQYQSPG